MLLEATKCKINKNKNSENESHLEIIEVVLVYCNTVNSNYPQKYKSFVCICSK